MFAEFVDRVSYRLASRVIDKDRLLPFDLREFHDPEKLAAPKSVPIVPQEEEEQSSAEYQFDPSRETRPYRHAKHIDRLVTEPEGDVSIRTLDDLWRHAHTSHRDKVCMGVRDLRTIHEEEHREKSGRTKTFYIPEFESQVRWFTFDEIDRRIESVARGVRDTLGLRRGDKLALYADTSISWQILAQALIRSGIVIVTVFGSLQPEAVLHCLEQTEATAVFTNNFDAIREIKGQLPQLKYIVWERKLTGGPITEDWEEKWRSLGQETDSTVISIERLEQTGQESSSPMEHLETPPSNDAMIMYTSGTTGAPKGVVMTHHNIVSALSGVEQGIDIQIDPGTDHCYLACLPLSHILEFAAELCVMYIGARIAYSSPRTLTNQQAKPCGDLEAYRPTIIAAVPRVLETIRKAAMSRLSGEETGRWRRKIFEKAFEAKKQALLSGHRDTPLLNKLVFDRFKSILGGRTEFILCGGAPLSEETQLFMRIVFGCSIKQGYGLTETCAMCAIQAETDAFRTRAVGTVVPAVEVKLVAVPEMNYRTDQECPEGEIWIRGPAVVRGYYKMEEKSREDFTEDGWFKSGDIGRFDERGILSVIDRKKYLVKLDTGEYISLETLENVYGNSPFVSASGFCVHADSNKSFPVALVLPESSTVKRWAERNSVSTENWEELLRDERLKRAVMESLEEQAKKARLGRNERVKDITLISDEWNPENGMLTAAMKFKRNEIAKRYRQDIDEMYGE